MSVDTVCQGCLSTDRNLYSITQFNNLLKQLRLFQFQKPQGKEICWECKSKLKNMQLFIDQVKQAQSILKKNAVHASNFPSLSTLSIVKGVIESNSSAYLHGEENYETHTKPVEIKVEKIIEDISYKHETSNDFTDDGDNYNGDDSDFPLIKDHVKLEEIKSEKSDKYRPSKKNGKLKKKFLKTKIKKETKYLQPILKEIEIKDLNFWLEKEKNSEFYNSHMFNCMNCFKIFKGLKQYQQHMDKLHKPSEFVCEVCTVGFDNMKDLGKHIANHYFIRECGVCQFQCYGRYNMRYHLRKHKEQKYQCDQCKHTFNLVSDFKQHHKALHRKCICDECGKSLSTKLMMERHFKTNHIKVDCKECNTTYKNQKNYNAHFNMRHVKYPAHFQELCYCVQCDMKFDNNALYKRHLTSTRAHRPAEKIEVPCPDCGKVYTRKTFMMNHYRLIHLNKTKFYCTICEKYMLNSTRYNYHMKYQHQKLEKEKNKLCSICGRGFNTNRTLSNHILTHTGERPYPCEICGARFSQKQAMQSHVKHVHFNVSRRKTR